MPGNALALKSVELYNKLISISPSENSELGQILWQLRQLRRANPSDFRVNVALMLALALSGEREEVDAIIQKFHQSFRSQDPEPLVTYMGVLRDVLRLSEAREVAEYLVSQPSVRVDKNSLNACFWIALAIGDIEWMRSFEDYQRAADCEPLAEDALESVEASNLVPYFSEHQAIVKNKLSAVSCRYSFMLVEEVNEPGTIVCASYTTLDRNGCRVLEGGIHEELQNFYQSKGEMPGLYIPGYTLMISPIGSSGPATNS